MNYSIESTFHGALTIKCFSWNVIRIVLLQKLESFFFGFIEHHWTDQGKNYDWKSFFSPLFLNGKYWKQTKREYVEMKVLSRGRHGSLGSFVLSCTPQRLKNHFQKAFFNPSVLPVFSVVIFSLKQMKVHYILMFLVSVHFTSDWHDSTVYNKVRSFTRLTIFMDPRTRSLVIWWCNEQRNPCHFLIKISFNEEWNPL